MTLEQELEMVLQTIVYQAKTIRDARCLAKEGLRLIAADRIIIKHKRVPKELVD